MQTGCLDREGPDSGGTPGRVYVTFQLSRLSQSEMSSVETASADIKCLKQHDRQLRPAPDWVDRCMGGTLIL